MPSRLPLPRLTLYTGGKECSLCEVRPDFESDAVTEPSIANDQVAKQDLASVYQASPFQLVLWNIRAPPVEASEREAKKWRRLYQYDIVSDACNSDHLLLHRT